MMIHKLFSSLLLLFLALNVQAQTDWGVPIDHTTKEIVYQNTIQIDDINAELLFNRGLNWILNYYTAGYKKIKYKSKAEGIIELSDRIILFKTIKRTKVNDAIIEYKLELKFKDGEYSYKIYKFYHFQHSLSTPLEKWMDDGKTDKDTALERFSKLNKEIEKLIESLQTSMLTALPEEG